MKFVSVVIPHFNDLANLAVCLDRLSRQTYPASAFEVIVADNNSRCGFAAVAAAAGDRATVILAEEQGAGPARNAGVHRARGDVLAFIDSDCVPSTHWLSEGLKALELADFIGGRVDVLPEVDGRLSPTEAFEAVFAFDFESYILKKRFTGSGNMFVRRDVFDKVGGFRTTVSEDMEWSHRAIAMGFSLAYGRDVVVGHPARRNLKELVGKWRRVVGESHAYHLQSGGGHGGWLMKAAVVFASPFAHVFRVLATPKLTGWSDRIGAAGVLFAIRFYRTGRMIALALDGVAHSSPTSPKA